jgi:hypothetical protein
MVINTKARLNFFCNLEVMFNGTIPIYKHVKLKCFGLVIEATLGWEAHITSTLIKIILYTLW